MPEVKVLSNASKNTEKPKKSVKKVALPADAIIICCEPNDTLISKIRSNVNAISFPFYRKMCDEMKKMLKANGGTAEQQPPCVLRIRACQPVYRDLAQAYETARSNPSPILVQCNGENGSPSDMVDALKSVSPKCPIVLVKMSALDAPGNTSAKDEEPVQETCGFQFYGGIAEYTIYDPNRVEFVLGQTA